MSQINNFKVSKFTYYFFELLKLKSENKITDKEIEKFIEEEIKISKEENSIVFSAWDFHNPLSEYGKELVKDYFDYNNENKIPIQIKINGTSMSNKLTEESVMIILYSIYLTKINTLEIYFFDYKIELEDIQNNFIDSKEHPNNKFFFYNENESIAFEKKDFINDYLNFCELYKLNYKDYISDFYTFKNNKIVKLKIR